MRYSTIGLAFTAASLVSATAPAFCGFYLSGADTKLYNNATQVVLMREGTRTVLSMQNNYQGPPSAFAMVVPVPVVLQKENVKTLPANAFDKIDQLDSPRLVEYWEQDPCAISAPEEKNMAFATAGGGGMVNKSKKEDLGVKIEAQFTVGEYEVVVLSAQDSTGLDTWLRREKYSIPAGAQPYLDPYVKAGSKFFVAKIDVKKVKFDDSVPGQKGMAALSPLRFHYDSTDFSLPVRLGLINSKDVQDLIVHVLARGQRYEVSNYDNVTIPTNIDVDEKVKGQFATFYAALFDETVKQHPKSVVTEYSWDASSCDPCPGPALDGADIATFGGDVAQAAEETKKKGRWGGGWVVTRLHARYDKNALGADLVFKAAPSIAGGREFLSEGGKLERGSKPDGTNNFQGRYAVRHPWTGALACENPHRGVWGGPPSGTDSTPMAARNLAFAPRGGSVQLAAFLKSDVPELSLTPAAAGSAPTPLVVPPPGPTAKGGCAGCAMSGTNAGALGLIGLVMLVLRKRLRR